MRDGPRESASRDGRWSDCAAASRPPITYITHTAGCGVNAFTTSPAVSTACAAPVATSIVRRSAWSASAPP